MSYKTIPKANASDGLAVSDGGQTVGAMKRKLVSAQEVLTTLHL
jgi:hypothetical protein